ncbi:TPA: NAD-dependent epimerase/dehydratase family protein [Candidatus Woesearchaeota archaeon]|nr:NAD-dependent epimerase/dehydratase [archaeon GW2011_AR15]MBS3103838.1 GDP-mannose 4,6-dehydratase [Candidatus Woesearchaeota archaeon]HIH40836.1 NAD-dependent epimerase/dehydratase family protein [Candidatus Woesearchaeota archaeon]
MAILVTGGAGFIGSHTCDALLKKNERVICLDNFNDYYPPEKKRKNIERNLASKNFILAETDITDGKSLEKVFGENKDISAIVHLAARAAARPSLDNPLLYAEVNILGTINLLELARKHGVKTFIFSSSSSVYGANKKMPFSEADITESQESPYAITKKTGEMLCKFYSETYGLNITCLRFFTVYGPRGRPDMAPYRFTEAIDKGHPVNMYGDGNSKRDYTYVDDVVRGILLSVEKSRKFEIINLGNGNPVELKKFISLIEKQLSKKAKIAKKQMPKGDVVATHADISKAGKILGYVPQTTIEEGLKKFIRGYKS